MITLICGYPRAGKTTYSQRFENVIHLDMMHTHEKVLARIRRERGDVVVEGVYYAPKHRKALLEAYPGSGSKCICLDTPLHIREERMGRKERHPHPFRIPTLDEGWDEIVIIRGGEEIVQSRSNEIET